MKSNQNNFAFIDSQNLNLAIRDQDWTLDWKKFRRYLEEKYQVDKAYLFIGYVESNESLYRSLREHGYILIFKPTFESFDGKVKGNVDAELVLHAMVQYNNYSQAVVVTGDGDFGCLIEYLREQNKLLVLLVPNYFKYSGLLKKAAAKRIAFCNALRDRMAYIKRTP